MRGKASVRRACEIARQAIHRQCDQLTRCGPTCPQLRLESGHKWTRIAKLVAENREKFILGSLGRVAFPDDGGRLKACGSQAQGCPYQRDVSRIGEGS